MIQVVGSLLDRAPSSQPCPDPVLANESFWGVKEGMGQWKRASQSLHHFPLRSTNTKLHRIGYISLADYVWSQFLKIHFKIIK